MQVGLYGNDNSYMQFLLVTCSVTSAKLQSTVLQLDEILNFLCVLLTVG